MDKKKRSALILLLLSVFLFSLNFSPNLTGAFVNGNQSIFNILTLLGFVFLMASFIIFTSRQTLDAIIIPTGGFKENAKRTKRALAEYEKRGTKYFVISGEKEKPKLRESHRNQIYRELRKYGIKPSQMKIEGKSKNTLENALYSLKKLRGFKDIGIVSYPEHLERFEYIVKKAKEGGEIPKDVTIHQIKTKQTLQEWIYGTLANIKERYRLRKGIKT